MGAGVPARAEPGEFKMNPIGRWLKLGIIFTVVVWAGAEGQSAGAVSSAESLKPASCTAPEYRQLDFWIGDWDAFDVDNPTAKVARNHVDLILEGCVLRENYEGADGHHGQSFSIYDASRKLWHQSWVTNRGELLIIEGKFEDGEMVLTGIDRQTAAQPLVRGIWKPVSGGVRETAATSSDGGKTWKPWFDLIFHPHQP
jgi:hypothetical protein